MIYNDYLKLQDIKSIAVTSSPLQLINFFELMIKKKLDPSGVLIIINRRKYGFNNIKKIKKFYSFENKFDDLKIIICDQVKIRLILMFFIFSFKKFKFIICGNYFDNESFYFFLLRSKLKFLVDDGTSTLLINKFKIDKLRKILFKFNLINTKKIYFFTVYKKKINNFFKLILNNYNFLEERFNFKKKIYKKHIYILGLPSNRLKSILNKDDYYLFIKKITYSFKQYKIFYLPHRREYFDKKFRKIIKKNKIKNLNNKIPVELLLIFKNQMPSIIFGFYSSALINLSCLNSKVIRLINFDINKRIKNKRWNSFSKYFKSNKKIENF